LRALIGSMTGALDADGKRALTLSGGQIKDQRVID
jgi:hypothetical protein